MLTRLLAERNFFALDYFIHAKLRTDDDRIFKSRLFVGFLFSLLAVIAVTHVYNTFFSRLPDASKHHSTFFLGVLGATVLVSAMLLKWRGLYWLSLNLMITIMLAVIVMAVLVTGGPFSSTTSFLLFIPPLFALMLSNFRLAIFWTMVTYVVMLTLIVMEFAGFSFTQILDRESHKINEAVILHVSYFCLALILAVYEFNNRHMRKRLREKQQLLNHYAHNDVLTDLPNRRAFIDTLETLTGDSFELVYIDLDGFKPINDRFGHAAGDAVLIEIARRLRGCLADPDMVFRVGGDEFTVIVDGVSVNSADQLQAGMLAALSDPYLVGDATIRLSASMGCAAYPHDTDDVHELITIADRRMYGNKHESSRLPATELLG